MDKTLQEEVELIVSKDRENRCYVLTEIVAGKDLVLTHRHDDMLDIAFEIYSIRRRYVASQAYRNDEANGLNIIEQQGLDYLLKIIESGNKTVTRH